MTHDRRRQVLLRLVALAASLAALAGIAYVLRSPDSRTDVRASGSPPRQSDAGADTQSPTTTGASASTTTTTQAAATSTTTAGTSGATLDPKPATWTAASASFTATVAVSATSLHVADVAHFVVTVEDEAGSLLRVGIDYGDGTPTGVPAPTHVDCHAAGEGASTTDRVHKQVTFDHAYRRAVTVAPRVVARSDGCNRSERALEATGELHVLAIAGAIPTNGPLRPTLTIDQNTSTNSTERAVSIVVAGTDLDGYIQRVELDWGDGSAPSVETIPLGQCSDDARFWAPSQRTVTFDHTFATPGEHTVVARVTSTGCTNADPQRSERSLTLTT